jgi:hypothetical protein
MPLFAGGESERRTDRAAEGGSYLQYKTYTAAARTSRSGAAFALRSRKRDSFFDPAR